MGVSGSFDCGKYLIIFQPHAAHMVKMSKTNNRNKESVKALDVKRNTKATSLLIIPLLVLTAILPLANVAYASPPTTVTGEWTLSSITSMNCTFVDEGVSMCNFTGVRTHTGDIAGTIDVEGIMLTNLHEGVRTIHAHGTFTGSVKGSSGQASAIFESKVDLATHIIDGIWVISQGTGGLEGVHGQGTWSGVEGVTGSLTGQIHFD